MDIRFRLRIEDAVRKVAELEKRMADLETAIQLLQVMLETKAPRDGHRPRRTAGGN